MKRVVRSSTNSLTFFDTIEVKKAKPREVKFWTGETRPCMELAWNPDIEDKSLIRELLENIEALGYPLNSDFNNGAYFVVDPENEPKFESDVNTLLYGLRKHYVENGRALYNGDPCDLVARALKAKGYKIVERTDGEDFNRGGEVFLFKVNDGNVYRVFCDTENDELIFQRIASKFVVDGDEYYSDAVDYKHVDGLSEDWHHYVIRWTDECEKFDPNFTEFKEDSSYNS